MADDRGMSEAAVRRVYMVGYLLDSLSMSAVCDETETASVSASGNVFLSRSGVYVAAEAVVVPVMCMVQRLAGVL